MSTVLGLDAGGTKTLAIWVDQAGRITHSARADGIDPTRSDNPGEDLRSLLEQLAQGQGPVVAATLGLPYYGEIGSLTVEQQRVATQSLGPLARACNDVEVAHIGAFGGEDGLLCLAGTGSMAWAKGPAGTARTGGFGDLIGDEGSAFWIGRMAISRLSRAADGREPSSTFATALATAADLPLHDLIDWTYRHDNPRAAIAQLARPVSNLAAQGDETALQIIRAAAAELALAATAAARRAGLAQTTKWSSAGSVFRGDVFRSEIARLLGSEPQLARLPPVGGAALDAARRAGWSTDDTWIATLRQHLEHLEAAASDIVKEAS